MEQCDYGIFQMIQYHHENEKIILKKLSQTKY